MIGVQPVPETVEVREAYMLHGRGLDFRSVAVAQGDAFDAWLSAHDSEVATRNYALGQQDPVRALPDREEAIEGLRVAMLGTTDGDFIHPESPIPAGEMFRLASEYLEALFGQEDQR